LSWTVWALVIAAALLFVVFRFAFLEYRLAYLRRTHPRWLATILDNDDAPHLSPEDLPYLKRVLSEAGVGIEQISWPQMEMAGWGYVAKQTITLLDNLLLRNDKILHAANQKWSEAIGAYHMRRNDTVNPIRWVITLWNLPKAVARTIGADQDAWPVRIIQVVYQLAVVVGIGLQLWDTFRR
jgi:hypothetical protein